MEFDFSQLHCLYLSNGDFSFCFSQQEKAKNVFLHTRTRTSNLAQTQSKQWNTVLPETVTDLLETIISNLEGRQHFLNWWCGADSRKNNYKYETWTFGELSFFVRVKVPKCETRERLHPWRRTSCMKLGVVRSEPSHQKLHFLHFTALTFHLWFPLFKQSFSRPVTARSHKKNKKKNLFGINSVCGPPQCVFDDSSFKLPADEFQPERQTFFFLAALKGHLRGESLWKRTHKRAPLSLCVCVWGYSHWIKDLTARNLLTHQLLRDSPLAFMASSISSLPVRGKDTSSQPHLRCIISLRGFWRENASHFVKVANDNALPFFFCADQSLNERQNWKRRFIIHLAAPLLQLWFTHQTLWTRDWAIYLFIYFFTSPLICLDSAT